MPRDPRIPSQRIRRHGRRTDTQGQAVRLRWRIWSSLLKRNNRRRNRRNAAICAVRPDEFPEQSCKRVLQASASGHQSDKQLPDCRASGSAESRLLPVNGVSIRSRCRWYRGRAREPHAQCVSVALPRGLQHQPDERPPLLRHVPHLFEPASGRSAASLSRSCFQTPASTRSWTTRILFSPTLLNDAGFTVVRAVGSNPGTANNRDLPRRQYFRCGWIFNQWGPAGWVHENFNWHDVLTWTHGRHTFSGGIDVDRHHDDDNFTAAVLRPTFGFANLIDFAQDQPFSQSGPTVNVADPSTQANLYQVLRWIYLGGFVQDDFKAHKKAHSKPGASLRLLRPLGKLSQLHHALPILQSWRRA